MFEEKFRFNKHGRSGILQIRDYEVKTPLFMPVGTRGAVKSCFPDMVFDEGAQIILGNTYHLHLRPGEKVIKQLGGLHNFMNWKKGPILTDSGGFQVFSMSKIRKITEEGVIFKDPVNGNMVLLTPEKSIQIQYDLGSDIIMAFDDVTGLSKTERIREKEALSRTHRWLDRCIAEYKKITKNDNNPPLLFGIVQGGLDKELRKKSLEFIQSTDVAGVAIGGLSVGESHQEMHEMLDYLASMYDDSRPRYLMGVGEPKNLKFAIEHGIDMFDCVLPTRNARHGTAWISGDQKINLKNEKYKSDGLPIDSDCNCFSCNNGFSRGFLRHQLMSNEPLAGSLISLHNMRYLHRITEGYRNK